MSFDTTIPLPGKTAKDVGRKKIPLPDFLFEKNKLTEKKQKRKLTKHHDTYHKFCKWSAMPDELRKPKTQAEFERKHRLTPFQCSQWKKREDFYALRLEYFWKMLFDQFPNVVHAVAKRAQRNSSADARIFMDLVGKKLELDKPTVQNITPITIIGVSQKEMEKFHVPEGYEDAVEKTVKEIGGSSE